MRLTPILWLIVLAGLALSSFGLGEVLSAQESRGIANWVTTIGRVLVAAWIGYGLLRWRSVRWVARIFRIGVITIIAGVLAQLCLTLGFPRGAMLIGSIYAMWLTFVVGSWLLHSALVISHPVVGVARTLITEATESKLAFSFIAVLFVTLPAVQIFVIAAETRVEYQIKSFLVFSLILTGSLLGFLTVLQGTWSVSRDREARQAHLTLTKPVSRFEYLVGKWLGLVLLNGLLVSVAGLGIYLFSLLLYQDGLNQGMAPEDRAAVEQRVLAARQSQTPVPNNDNRNLDNDLQARVIEVARDNNISPEQVDAATRESIRQEIIKAWYRLGGMGGMDASDVQQEYLFTDLPKLWNPIPVLNAINTFVTSTDRATREETKALINQELSLAPRGPDGNRARTLAKRLEEDGIAFELVNIIQQKLPPESVQLQFKPRAAGDLEDDRVRLVIAANGVLVVPPQFDPDVGTSDLRNFSWALPDDTRNTIQIDPQYIDGDGNMIVSIMNQTPGGSSLSFNVKDGIQLLYRKGGFELNFAKTIALLWLRLMFISMVAVAAASFLSFPVAAMLSFLVFFAAVGSTYIGESLSWYSALRREVTGWEYFVDIYNKVLSKISEGEPYEVFKILMVIVGDFWLFLMPDLSRANATLNIRDGRIVPWSMLGWALLRIGLVATGIALAVGWFSFRRRELARVIV